MATTRTTRASTKSAEKVLKEGLRNSPASPAKRRSTRRSPRSSQELSQDELRDADDQARGMLGAAEVSQENKENRKKISPSSKRGVQTARRDSPSKRRRSGESEREQSAANLEQSSDTEEDIDDIDDIEEEQEFFTSRSSAASTAKRGSGYDNEALVDLCVKVLTQGCGLRTGTPLLLAEARANREEQITTNEEDDEDNDDEEAVYAEFASSLAGQLTTEGNSEGSNPTFLLFGKRSKSVEKNFVHFWNQLITLMHGKETLYSDSQGVDFLTCMRHVCVELSKSEVRAFRYAACVCGYALLGSLAQVHQVLSETNVLLTKQLRGTDSRNKGQRKDINKRMQVCHERSNIVDINMKTLFQELVIVRFRDVAPQVRALTIQWVGTWVVLHPQKFLSDGYLKYVAWSLNDKDAHVRVSAVDALKKVYEKHAVSPDTAADGGGEGAGAGSFSNFSALDLLTQRFHGRFTELIRDNDEHVCINALELVVCLAKAGLVDVNSNEIDSNVALLLLDKSDKVRANAGKLAACMVDQRLSKKQKKAANKRRSGADKKTKGDDKAGDCVEVCKIVCKLIVEGLPESVVERASDQVHNSPSSILTGQEEVFVGAITAVVPHLSPSLIHDWDVLAEACKNRKGANNNDETLVCVVRVVLAAIRHFTSPKMIRLSLTKRTSSSAIVDLCETSQQKFTLSFMRVLSILLAQCKSKAGSVFNSLSCLLSALCSKMKQELFVAKRDSEKDFESIVQSLHDLCLKTNSVYLDSMAEDTVDTLDMHVVSCLRCLMSLDKTGAAVTREKAQKKLKDILEGLLKSSNKVMDLINGPVAPTKGSGKKNKRTSKKRKSSSKGGMYDMTTLEEDAVFKLRSHLLRLHALQQLGVFQPAGLSKEKGETLDCIFFDSLQGLIRQCCDLDDEDYVLEPSTMQLTCLNMFDSLLWKLQGIQQESPADDTVDALDAPTKERIAVLVDMQQEFVNQLEKLYSLYPTSEDLQKTIYTVILDLTFSVQKCAAKWTAKIEEEDLKNEILGKIEPSEAVFKVLWDFCKRKCFDVLLLNSSSSKKNKKDANNGDDDKTAQDELVAAQSVLSPLLRVLSGSGVDSNSNNAPLSSSSPGGLWLLPELFSYTSISNKTVSNALKKLWQSTNLMETTSLEIGSSTGSPSHEDKVKIYVRGLQVAYLRWKESDMNADRLALNQLCTFIGRHYKKTPAVLLEMLELAINGDKVETETASSSDLEPMELVNEVLVQYIDKLEEEDVKKLAKVVSKSSGKEHLQELYQLLQDMDPEIPDQDFDDDDDEDDAGGAESDQEEKMDVDAQEEEEEEEEDVPPPPPRSTRRRL
jgi:hypothetical protein